MPTLNQLVSTHKRLQKKHKIKSPSLMGNPHKKGICRKIYTVSPKKPNSGTRKVVRLSILRKKKKRIISHVPGEGGHNLQVYSVVLIRGARIRDIPGMKYRCIRGANKSYYDLIGLPKRKTSRSKYGTFKF